MTATEGHNGPASDAAAICGGTITERARAKINLTLEIRGRRPDGYHELESLVAFADFGDVLTFRPGSGFLLTMEGPFAAALEGEGNLIETAATRFTALTGQVAGGAFNLVKNLPVAAGIGGGSADAAACLRILRLATGRPGTLEGLMPAARGIGADVSCCVYSRAAIMTGIGETLHPLAGLAPIPAVLVNPMLPLATGPVFRALEAGPLKDGAAPLRLPALGTPGDVVAYAIVRRNDLEAPARQLLPVIGDILSALNASPGALLTRMSGSGPTCFALFSGPDEAARAALRIGAERPEWWVKPVTLS